MSVEHLSKVFDDRNIVILYHTFAATVILGTLLSYFLVCIRVWLLLRGIKILLNPFRERGITKILKDCLIPDMEKVEILSRTAFSISHISAKLRVKYFHIKKSFVIRNTQVWCLRVFRAFIFKNIASDMWQNHFYSVFE